MARGIILFGSAGSGKTTLGRLVAKELEFPYLLVVVVKNILKVFLIPHNSNMACHKYF